MKRIPTIIGLVLVVAMVGVVAVSTALVGRVTSFFSKASTGELLVLPPAVANISDTGFTVYWLTAKSVQGVVSLSDRTVSDDQPAFVHFIQVSGLKPATKYTFKVNPGNLDLEATTLAQAEQASDPIFGKVADTSDAIVVWENKTATVTKSDGSFVLPVYGVKSGQQETITITALAGTATIVCIYGNDQPLPTVKIGDNINCDVDTKTAPRFNTPVSTPSAAGGQLQILLKDKETVSTPLPTISGKAGPNQVVKIEIHSPTPYSGTVVADREGNWSWTPPANLTPGEHTATITITNLDGTTQTVTRTFFVSSGEPILPVTSGTPSAIIEPTPLPLPPPPPIIEPVVPATPAAIIQMPATPATGAFENTLLLIVIGFGLIALGVGLVVL